MKCVGCKKTFHPKDVSKGTPLYCSEPCFEAGMQRAENPRRDPVESPAVRKAVARFNAVIEIREALDESVKLQSHYARLLNMHDGGKRLEFKDSNEWMARLRKLKGDRPERSKP